MTVADFLAFTRRHWILLLVTVVIGALAGGAYGVLSPKTYQSSASGFVASQGSTVFGGTDATIARAKSYLPLITSAPVREKIANAAGVPASSLNGRLTASIPEDATLITVTATAADPQSAVTLANGALTALADVIGDIEKEVVPKDGGALVVVPMENAVAPTGPISPNLKMSVGVGALAGLVVGYLIAALRRITDVKVRTGTELEELTGAGLLGRIPRVSMKGGKDVLSVEAGESLRQIRTGLRFASVDEDVRTIVVTSAQQGEGKTTIAAALARMIARGGQPTLLMDADLRRPRVADELGIDGSVGLSQVLSGQATLADVLRRTDEPHLLALPAGGIPPSPSEMLGSARMKSLLEELAAECVVVIDAPPVLPVTDTLLVGSAADGVVIVASVGKTHKTDVQAMRRMIEQAKVRVLGCVLNRVPARESADGYSYRRQYRSYYADTKPAVEEAPGVMRHGVTDAVTTSDDDVLVSLLSSVDTEPEAAPDARPETRPDTLQSDSPTSPVRPSRVGRRRAS